LTGRNFPRRIRAIWCCRQTINRKFYDEQLAAESAATSVTEEKAHWVCPTCSKAAEAHYCQNCGEKRPDDLDLSIGYFLSQVGELLFNWDSKMFRSLRLLFSKPGFLASENVRGCRKLYLHPVQTFVIVNLIYFVLFPLIGWSGLKTPLNVYRNHDASGYSAWASQMASHRAAVKGMSADDFRKSFDHVIDEQSRSLVFVMVPIFSLAVWLLECRKRRFYGEHLVFSFYFYAFWLAVAQIVVPAAATLVLLGARHFAIGIKDYRADLWMGYVLQVVLGAYLFIALRQSYRDSAFWAAAKALALTFATFYILDLYRFILFLTALYTA